MIESEDRLADLSWYLVVLGFIAAIGGAALILLLDRISYRDFFINADALGWKLVMGGGASYFVGRGIYYYRRFRKKAGGHDEGYD